MTGTADHTEPPAQPDPMKLSWIGIEAKVIDASDAAGTEYGPHRSGQSADNIVAGLRKAGIPVTDDKPSGPTVGEIFRAADGTTPMDVLRALGAQFSPDLDAYASGRIEAHQVRCVLCKVAPCACLYCEATYENRYYLATGRPQFERCGMRVDPATGQCPRGSADDHLH